MSPVPWSEEQVSTQNTSREGGRWDEGNVCILRIFMDAIDRNLLADTKYFIWIKKEEEA